MKTGQKHLIKCRCVLHQLRNTRNPPNHMFVVFSVIDGDVVQPKFVQCNNCGIVHKVIDISRSEIVAGKEHMRSIVTLDDVKASLPEKLVGLLDANGVDLPSYEAAAFIIDNKRWGEIVVLSSEVIDGERQGKYVRIIGEGLYRVESFSREEVVK